MPELTSHNTNPGFNTRRGRSDWEQLMAQYEASGLTQRAFCEQHGLGYSTFCYWRKHLRQSAATEKPSAVLIELPMFQPDQASDWRIELDLGQGIVLRLK
jgi:transposase-like protein